MAGTASNPVSAPGIDPGNQQDYDSGASSTDYINPNDFDYPDEDHNNTPEDERKVNVTLKDAHDTTTQGMMIEMPWLSTFQNLFKHFKARSCKTCRAPDEMRFKIDRGQLFETDSPKTSHLWHNTTTEITVWSNVPGLRCDKCQKSGYPSTDGLNKTLYRTTILPLPTPINTNATKPETVALTVANSTGFKMVVKMLNTNEMKYLMEAYAERTWREMSICRFHSDGERLEAEETPKTHGMISGDTVDVFFEQFGG